MRFFSIYECHNVCRRFLCIPILFLTSCTKLEVADQAFQFNEAVGSTASRLLLLNAVRASKGYPLQFTKLSGYDGGNRWQGEVDPSLPIPFAASRQYTIGPKLTFSPGVTKLTLADLNTAEAQEGFRRHFNFNDWRYYQSLGWEPNLVQTLAIEQIRVREEIYRAINLRASNQCTNSGRSQSLKCRRAFEVPVSCEPTVARFLGHDVYVFLNDPKSPCQYKLFQSFRAKLGLVGHIIRPHKFPSTKRASKAKSYHSAGTTITINNVNQQSSKDKGTKKSDTIIFSFHDTRLTRMVMDYRETEKTTGVIGFEYVFRSPERMVRFLGDVIFAQNHNTPPFYPDIVVGEEAVELFRVEAGMLVGGHGAVSIKGPEGMRFSIPIPDRKNPHHHRSLRALTFVADQINRAVSKDALPQFTTFTLTGASQ